MTVCGLAEDAPRFQLALRGEMSNGFCNCRQGEIQDLQRFCPAVVKHYLLPHRQNEMIIEALATAALTASVNAPPPVPFQLPGSLHGLNS